MKRIIEDKSILKSPGLYGVVGGEFVCVRVCGFLFVCFSLFTQCKILLPFIREKAESHFWLHSFHMSSEPSLKRNVEAHAISYNIPQPQTSRKVKIFNIRQIALEMTCSHLFFNLIRK